MDGLSTKLVKGTAILATGMILSKAFTFAYRVLIARFLGPNDYGLFALAFVISSVLSLLPSFGLSVGLPRFIGYYRGKKDEEKTRGVIQSSLRINLAVGFIIAALLFLLSDWIALEVFHEPGLALLLKLFAFLPLLKAITESIAGVFYAFEKPLFDVITNKLFQSTALFVLTLLFLQFSPNILGITLALMTSIIAALLLGFYLMEKHVFSLFGKTKPVMKELMAFSIPLAFSGFLWSFLGQIDTLMLGYFENATTVGIYDVAYLFALTMFIASNSTQLLLMPSLTRLFAENNLPKFKRLYHKTMLGLAAVGLAFFIFFLFFAYSITTFFFGIEFAGAATPLVILALGFIVFSACGPSNSVLNALKKPKTQACIGFTVVVVDIILNYTLIPLYGMNGAATATAASFALGGLLFYRFARKALKKEEKNVLEK